MTVQKSIVVNLSGKRESLFNEMGLPLAEETYLLVWDEEGVWIPWRPGQSPREAIIAWAKEQMPR